MDVEKIESLKIKTPEQVQSSKPIPPKGYWWKTFLSSCIWIFSVTTPVFLSLFIFIYLIFGIESIPTLFLCMFFVCILCSVFIADNIGPLFTDKSFSGLLYYKKRMLVWNSWWYETWRYKRYLEDKDRYESA